MGLTKNQQYAVDHRGSTLLVSAGAGSGKTSTLSKRIISRISDRDDPCEITDFLIVTFTNASAHDLSEKIERAVSECVSKDLGNKKAFRQLSKMKYANISTISSFCLNVVKSHFQLLGLPAKIRVCDEAEAQILKKRAISEIINEKYSEEPDGSVFYDLVELFSGSKSDEGFENLIDKLHRKLIIFSEPREWADSVLAKYDEVCHSCSETYLNTHFGSSSLEFTQRAAKSMISELSDACDMVKDIPEMQRYYDAMQIDIDSALQVINLSCETNYEQARLIIMGISKTKFLPVKYDQDFKDTIKGIRDASYKRFDAMRNNFFSADFEKVCLCARDSKRILEALFDIIFEVDDRFQKQKASYGVVDFSDAERMTYKLFVEKYDKENDIVYPSEIAKKYRDAYAEIYIDEYQDVNPVQDMIFRSITRYSQDGYETNRFMVGDIKQSIYRFRGARPNLFAGYLDSFVSSDSDSLWAKKEFLSENFRCSESVINFTNLVFSRIMKKSYTENEALKYSRTENCPVKYPCDICVFDEDDSDDYYDAEIKHTAQKILEIVDSENQLSSDGKRFTFGDIAVLMPSPKKVAEKYVRYFEAHGIPTYSEITENFFENSEIILMLCILNTIDNSMRDIYVAGAMRSEIFGFSDDEMLEIRRLHSDIATKSESLWENVTSLLNTPDCISQSLLSKCKCFVDTIESLRKFSIGNPSDKLILKIYSDLHVNNVVSEKSFNRYTNSPSLRRENLSILYNLARGFEKNGFRGLSAFLEFLNIRADKPESVRSATSSDQQNAVHIMSVHHSKGLEYPVCILCGVSKHFNKNDERERLVMSDDMGIGFKLRDLPSVLSADSHTSMVTYDTPFRFVVKAKEGQALLEEQKRVLYVAMTRAKDKLCIMLKRPENQKLSAYYRRSLKNTSGVHDNAFGFYDWIFETICAYKSASVLFEDYSFERSKAIVDETNCFSVSVHKLHESFYGISSENNKISEEKISAYAEKIKQRISFEYPFTRLTKIPAKLSVSDINTSLINENQPVFDKDKADIKKPRFLSEELCTPAEKGTATHLFMQFADFSLAEKNAFDEAKRLLSRGYLDDKQYSVLDYNKISAFFESEIYSQIKSAVSVYRESPFTLLVPVSELYGEDSAFENETILLQGIIDCLFVSADGTYTVVDFKTDSVKNTDILAERYSTQLEYYKKAVKEMTGSENVRAVIYSFYTGKTVEI